MNKKGFVNIIILGAVVVILLGILGYFIFARESTMPVIFQKFHNNNSSQISIIKNKAIEPNIDATTTYPYFLKSLSESKLRSLDAEFKDLNNLRNCNREVGGEWGPDSSVLNSVGLLNEACEKEMHEFKSSPKIIDKNKLIERAKDWIIKNSKFTGVFNRSDLIVVKTLNLYENKMRILFEKQIYKDLPVEHERVTSFDIIITEDGISRAIGHWYLYQNLDKIPLKLMISEDSAKNKLIGKRIEIGDVIVGLIRQEDMNKSAIKVIFIKEDTHGIEFRLAWKIPIRTSFYYIDATTGETLASFLSL